MTRHILLATLLLTAGGLHSRATAQVGAALAFDGNDQVEVFDTVHIGGALTLECWVRADALDAGRVISNREDFFTGYEVLIVQDGTVAVAFDGSQRARVDVNAYLSDWFHLAVTWAGPEEGTIRVYANGVEIGTGMSTLPISDSMSTFVIGKSGTGLFPFTGGIDEVRVWSSELAPATISDWMSRHLTPEHPDHATLEGAWEFEENEGQVASSVVGGPALAGQLGTAAAPDDGDPTWIQPDVTPIRSVSLGELKGIFLR